MSTTTTTRRKWDVAEIAEFRSKNNPDTGRQYSLAWCRDYIADKYGVKLTVEAVRIALLEDRYRDLVKDDDVTPKQLPWKLTEELAQDYIGYGCRAVAAVGQAETRGTVEQLNPRIVRRAEMFREWLDRHGPDQVVQLDPSAHGGRGGWIVRPRDPDDERGRYGFMIRSKV